MSAKIVINTSQAEQVAGSLKQLSSQMTSLRSSVNSVKSNCGITGSYRQGIVNSLSNVVQAMEKEQKSLNTMSEKLSSIVTLYQSTEAALADVGAAAVATGGSTGGNDSGDSGLGLTAIVRDLDPLVGPNIFKTTGSTTDETGSSSGTSSGVDLGSLFWKVLGGAGILGGGASAIGTLLTGGELSLKDWMTAGKYAAKAVGAVAGATTSTSWAQYLIGANSGLSGISTDTFGAAFQSYFTKLGSDLTDFSSAAKSVKAVTKWAGYLLTIGSNAYDSYGEYKSGEIGGGEAVAKTAFESAVDIGMTVGATALFTAAAAAAGVTSPIWGSAAVIGAAAAATTWGVDTLCKYFTGSDASELLWDGVTYIGEKTVQVAAKVTETVGSAVNTVVEKATEAVDAVKDAAGNAVNTVKDTANSAVSTITGWFGSASKAFAW